MSEAEQTPVDRPVRLSDLNDMRAKVYSISEKTIEMYDATMASRREMQELRGQFRTYVALCAACTFFSVAAATISVVASTAQARVTVVP